MQKKRYFPFASFLVTFDTPSLPTILPFTSSLPVAVVPLRSAMLCFSTAELFFDLSVTEPAFATSVFFAYASLNWLVGLLRIVAPNAAAATARAVATASAIRAMRLTGLLSEGSGVTLPAAA